LRQALGWLLALVVGLAAVVGLIALLNSRDDSEVSHEPGPGRPYRGEPVLSPALEDAVKRGNVVVLYRDKAPPARTQALVPPGGKALEGAGQSVVLEREPALKTPLAAVSKTRIERANRPEELQVFIDYWVGA
jgi:hypothetical protein